MFSFFFLPLQKILTIFVIIMAGKCVMLLYVVYIVRSGQRMDGLQLTLLRRMDVIDVQKIRLSYDEWTSLTSIVKSIFFKFRKLKFRSRKQKF